MKPESSSTIDRQTLLAAIPAEWQAKFHEELSRSPILKLVALQVSQHLIEAYRQRLELAMRSDEVEARKLHSSYIQVKRSKNGEVVVSLNLPKDSLSKPLATTEEQAAKMLTALNFWEASASYMWHDLTKMAIAEMRQNVGQTALEAMDQDDRLNTLYRYIFDEASDSLKSNFSTVLEVYLDQAVQLIVNKYDLPSKTLQELE